jgi:hypothetical protein
MSNHIKLPPITKGHAILSSFWFSSQIKLGFFSHPAQDHKL